MTGPLDPVHPRPAATVAVLRDGPRGPEVLLTERPATMAFGPRLHVFPGGAIDAADGDPRILARLRPPSAADPDGSHGSAAVVAAIREAWEEAGILLATGRDAATMPSPADAAGTPFHELVLARDLELRGDRLAPLSRWVTPPVVPRRFDARFFVAWLPSGAAPVFDPREVAGHAWMTPAAALDAMAGGLLELWMPTSTTLQQLLGIRRPDDLALLGRRPVTPPGRPVVEAVDGLGGDVVRITSHGGGGVLGVAAHAWVIGRGRVVIVDPGDPSDAAADAIADTVRRHGARVGAVLVTAPAPDRAAGAEGIALRFGVPLLAAAAAGRVLAAAVRAVEPGEELGASDVPLRVTTPAARAGGPGYGPDAVIALALPDRGAVVEGGPDLRRS